VIARSRHSKEDVMGSTFGPFYPSPLQESINHAERLGEELRRLDGETLGSPWKDPLAPTDAEVWIFGRVEEMETMVADVAREWRGGLLSAVGAATVLDHYLDAVHAGLGAAFGVLDPTCCAHPSVTRIALHAAPHEMIASMAQEPARPNARCAHTTAPISTPRTR
jgi:hypothetical protein